MTVLVTLALLLAGQQPAPAATAPVAPVAQDREARLDALVAELRTQGLSGGGLDVVRREMQAGYAARAALLPQLDEARRARSRAWGAASPDPDRVAAASRGVVAAQTRIDEAGQASIVAIFRAIAPADRAIFGTWLATYYSQAAVAP